MKCVYCAKTVRKNQHAISCDVCGNWTHRLCGTNISKEDYLRAQDQTINFMCSISNVPVGNFSLNATIESSLLASSERSTDELQDISNIETPTADISYNENVQERSMEEDVVGNTDDNIPKVGFTKLEKGSQKGKPLLVDGNGYTYVIKGSNSGNVYWRCSKRTDKIKCNASVKENLENRTFEYGKNAHSHPTQPGKLQEVQVRREVKDSALGNMFMSARAIVEEVSKNVLDSDMPPDSRNNPENYIRAANRVRELNRPKHPKDLNFNIVESAIPEGFFQADLTVKGERHILLATERQLQQLSISRQWFIDGTFKIVKRPFYQLMSIHGFVRSGRQVKLVPLFFALMSRRRTIDYIAILKKIEDLLPNPPQLKTAVMDFEAATWKAFGKVFPQVHVRGCLFHFTQAIWRHCQELGLQNKYKVHGGTHNFIKKLMSLPFLPKSHIRDIFHQLQGKTSNDKLIKLMDYMERQWIDHSLFKMSSWSVFNQTIRTNNNIEGWHRRINHKAGEQQLGMYKLIDFLFGEADMLPLQAALLFEGKLRRYFIRTCTNAQEEIYHAWREYENGDLSASMMLRICSRHHGPIE
ncbi:hypothetical protein SNE40_009939 [Patella caerulea]|uniref:MULE transposase domain-containing protein n=1 Tax=Patella caerulea TaxID=87958 RepID=A0AAN8JPJ2_PATCE